MIPTIGDDDHQSDDDEAVQVESGAVVDVEEHPSDEEDEGRAEGLEAGEAAALARKKKVLPKPVECCITLNRYSLSFKFS